MPYIKKEKRHQYDVFVDQLASLLDPEDFEGDLNYIISTLIHKIMPLECLHYADMNKIIGVLECAKQEYYRKIMSPYEDKKESENGKID